MARGAAPATSRGGVGPRRWRLVRADSAAVSPSVRRFMRRARRRRMRAALPWALAGGVLSGALLTIWAVYGTALFGVWDVKVVGNELVTAEQVRQAAAVPEGVPLARVDLAAVRSRVARLAPVDRVTVSRDWPDALLVEVVERTAVAAVPRNGRFVVLDRSGVAFRTLPARPAALPLVRLGAPGPDDLATRGALEVLEALTPVLRDRLVEMVVEGPARITLRLRGDRTVVWGDSSRSDTKARVAEALLARSGDVLDVSAPDVVTIR